MLTKNWQWVGCLKCNYTTFSPSIGWGVLTNSWQWVGCLRCNYATLSPSIGWGVLTKNWQWVRCLRCNYTTFSPSTGWGMLTNNWQWVGCLWCHCRAAVPGRVLCVGDNLGGEAHQLQPLCALPGTGPRGVLQRHHPGQQHGLHRHHQVL